MSHLEEIFRSAQGPLLMPYAVGGYPDQDTCLEIGRLYQACGAGLVELGIPFSDPLADGPVIQAASQAALTNRTTPWDVLDAASSLSREGAKVVLLSYLNIILALGPECFFVRCRDAGVLGVVVPDLPAEEAPMLCETARRHEVDVVLLAAPTSTDERLARIAQAASGFIYCVSNTGVTGARTTLRSDLAAFLTRVRRHTVLPLAVGFGISTPEQAGEVAALADGVIIGSKLVEIVAHARAQGSNGWRTEICSFLKEARVVMDAGARSNAGRSGFSATD
jgi:tryptophan synthase alpha chain